MKLFSCAFVPNSFYPSVLVSESLVSRVGKMRNAYMRYGVSVSVS